MDQAKNTILVGPVRSSTSPVRKNKFPCNSQHCSTFQRFCILGLAVIFYTIGSLGDHIKAQDLTAGISALQISQGPYAGAYTIMLNDGRMNWYFCNLGLIPMVESHPIAVRNYLDLYLKNTDTTNGTIEDFIETVGPQTSDSDDSYAATFISLAARFRNVKEGKIWWKANIKRIKEIADQVLVQQQKANGLVTGFVKNRDFRNDPANPMCQHNMRQLTTVETRFR